MKLVFSNLINPLGKQNVSLHYIYRLVSLCYQEKGEQIRYQVIMVYIMNK